MSDYVIAKDIKPFLDEEGRLTALPSKNRKKLHALYYIATQLDADKQWNEEQISILLDELVRAEKIIVGGLEIRYLIRREICRVHWHRCLLPLLIL